MTEELPACDGDDLDPDEQVGDLVDPDIELVFAPAEDEDGGDA